MNKQREAALKTALGAVAAMPRPSVGNKIEDVAINLSTIVPTLQMCIETLPQDGRVGEVPEVLALCRNYLADQQQILEQIVEKSVGEARL